MSARTKILIVEDDPHILLGLEEILKNEGHEVAVCSRGDQALDAVARQRPSLVVLDVMLPGVSGYDVCKQLRAKKITTPILMLTAKGQEMDKVIGLDLGADDYVTKPFGLHELLARLRTALRHARRPDDGGTAPVFTAGDLTVDLERRLVRKKDQEIRLTATEYKLLTTLIKHAGKVLTHRQLLKEVWGPLHVEEAHYLRVYMRQLRNKLETNPAHPSHLVTEVGVGYRLRID